MVTIKTSKNRMIFAVENFKVRNLVVCPLTKNKLICGIRANEVSVETDVDFIALMTFKV